MHSPTIKIRSNWQCSSGVVVMVMKGSSTISSWEWALVVSFRGIWCKFPALLWHSVESTLTVGGTIAGDSVVSVKLGLSIILFNNSY
jgi:hypothetical protein